MKVVSDFFRLWLSLRPAQRVDSLWEKFALGFLILAGIFGDLVEHGTWTEIAFHTVAALHAASLASCLVSIRFGQNVRPPFPGTIKRIASLHGIELLLIACLLTLLQYGSVALAGETATWGLLFLRVLVLQLLIGSLVILLHSGAWLLDSDWFSARPIQRFFASKLIPLAFAMIFVIPGILLVVSGNPYFFWVGVAPFGFAIWRQVFHGTNVALWKEHARVSIDWSRRFFLVERLRKSDSLFPSRSLPDRVKGAFLLQSYTMIPAFLGAAVVWWLLDRFFPGQAQTMDSEGIPGMPFWMMMAAGFIIDDIIRKRPLELSCPGLMGYSRIEWANSRIRYSVAAWLAGMIFWGICFVALPWLIDAIFGTAISGINDIGSAIPVGAVFFALVGTAILVGSSGTIPLKLRSRVSGLGEFPSFRWNWRAAPVFLLFLGTCVCGILMIKTHRNANLFDPASWNGTTFPFFVVGFLLLGIAAWVWSFRLQYRAILERDLV